VRITAASALRGSNSSRPGASSLLLLLLAPSAAALLLLLAGLGSARPAMRLGRKPSLLRAVAGVAQRLQGSADSLSI
jgi:hypothetical protein